MRILFYSNQIGFRGTEVALYDYAYFNKIILNNESFIGCPFGCNKDAAKKFEREFGKIHEFRNIDDVDKFIEMNRIDFFYKICAGYKEDIPKNCKVGVHVVFNHFDVFGDKYVYISDWLKKYATNNMNYTSVPHMINLPDNNENLRNELKINNDDIVFGYHGGHDSFNIQFVKDCIKLVSSLKNNYKFIFMNVEPFCNKENVIFLPGSQDLNYKVKFINTCSAMIHARDRGETFGLSVAEFSSRNKPIITYRKSPEKCHIHILKETGIYYDGYEELFEILYNFKVKEGYKYDCYSKDFNPNVVMKLFLRNFLNSDV